MVIRTIIGKTVHIDSKTKESTPIIANPLIHNIIPTRITTPKITTNHTLTKSCSLSSKLLFLPNKFKNPNPPHIGISVIPAKVIT